MEGLFCYFTQTKMVSQHTVRLYTGVLFSFDLPYILSNLWPRLISSVFCMGIAKGV